MIVRLVEGMAFKRKVMYMLQLAQVDLCATFLYYLYLFVYDDTYTFEWSMLCEDKSANEANGSFLNPFS